MTIADRELSEGCANGTVVLADFQQKGEGSVESRKWDSQLGENLLFNVCLRLEETIHRVPVAGMFFWSSPLFLFLFIPSFLHFAHPKIKVNYK